ncbi:MAG: cytochrome c oxidase subunit 3 [Saprospiraceae bacterium]|nr:cytochrome c oxidase subunit 3 [Saprospiraceae bacterium]
MSTIVASEYRSSKIHPKKFGLWIACASIAMMFTAFTSAYMVRQAQGNWLEFRLPNVFIVSTLVILMSSAALHGAYLAFKRGNEAFYKGLLVSTFILGVAFLILQYQGWLAMRDIGVELTTNPSGSFIYVISGVHAAHILGGIAALTIALIHAFALKYQVTSARKLRFELTLTYWHFVDFLWIYLFTFFILQS